MALEKDAVGGMTSVAGLSPGESIPTIHAFRNEIDEASAWLNCAYEQRNDGRVGVRSDSLPSILRGDLRHNASPPRLKLPL